MTSPFEETTSFNFRVGFSHDIQICFLTYTLPRRIADEHDIPIMENKALARSLYDRVEVERRIPPEFYRAVADIMILLQRRGQRKQF